MKKVTVVILTAVYLLSAIGVSASSFYCCGMLMSTSISIGESHATNAKSGIKAPDCCKTVKHSIKVKDNHYGADNITLTAKFSPALIPATAFVNLENKSFTKVHKAYNSHAPPVGQQIPIYTLYCTYLI